MPIDSSIALNANAPQPMNPLQTALQVAQYRTANAQGQALQQGIAANRATSAAYQQATDPTTGQVDNNKLVGILSQNPDAAYNLPQVIQGINTQKQQQQTLQQGAITMTGSQIDLANKMNQTIYQRLSTLDPSDPNFSAKILQNGADLISQYHADPAMVISHLQTIPSDPAGRAAWLQKGLASVSGTLENLKSLTPSPTMVDNGATKQYVDTNPLTNPGIVGTSIHNQLSPESATTPVGVMGPGNTPGVVPRGEMWNAPPLPSAGPTTPNGPDRTSLPGQAPAPANGPAHFVATGTPMGVQGSNDGNVATVNTHWGQLTNDANNAQTNIGLAQNIKAYASQAATGKFGDKLAAANGLLSIFGVGGQTDLNTATDLLQKNMARLSLSSRSAAGGTDAAGALATAANPHGSMTTTAIKDAADQVVGAQQMALSEQKLLQPYKLSNNVPGYQQAQTAFNQAADPRIWQFQNMDPQQRQAFKAGMSPADQQSFGQKIRTLESLGAIK